MITVKIDVTKIDKTKLFKGQKGTYLDIVLIETPDNQYGDSHMAVQGLPKADRDAGQKGAILGNAKSFGNPAASAAPAPAANPRPDLPPPAEDDEVPF